MLCVAQLLQAETKKNSHWCFLRLVSIRSQTIADRRLSRRELFPYNRRRSQTIAEPTVAKHFVLRKCTRTLCSRENKSKQHRGHRGEILLQTNLFLHLVLKRRQRQLQNRRKHQFWILRIFMKRKDKLNFSPIFCQLLAF